MKLDGSFIKDLDHSTMEHRDRRPAVVELAHTTGMTAVAEGVETAAQLEVCIRWGARSSRASSLPGP